MKPEPIVHALGPDEVDVLIGCVRDGELASRGVARRGVSGEPEGGGVAVLLEGSFGQVRVLRGQDVCDGLWVGSRRKTYIERDRQEETGK